jgi:tetratricopeptide (TPR) repeat protein/nucleoside phosphorylase
VVILTAIALEYRAALQVEAGAAKGSQWEEERGPNGLPVAFRTFHGKSGRPLRVAVAQAGEMGAVAATNALLPLVDAYQPRCVAMSGVCAGRPGKTLLGDVIAPERLFFHDTGKRLPDGVQPDLKTYNLRDDWKVALEHFDFSARFQGEEWWKKRPVPYEWQENWLLAQLSKGVADPSTLPECEEACPQWSTVLDSLWKSGMLEDGTLVLTGAGRKRIGRVLLRHRNQLPDVSPLGTLLPFKVHVAPMGSGNQVVEDAQVWDFISEHMRKTLGLEMEAAALGALAHAQRDRKLDALVMKGVMDFANHGRDDHFKEFAARASAECLLAFLREHLDVEVVPDMDDLLVSGTEGELPENPPPSALLNARYEVVRFHQQREGLLAELDRSWCDEGPSVAVRLLHAEGGVGKTRLAIEWIRRRRGREWAAGFLPKEVRDDWFDRLWALGQSVLVVIDYAESRADLRETLLRIHRYSQQENAGRLRRMRVLLLARNSGDWWLSLRQSDTALGAWLDVTPPYELPPLALKEVEREQVFNEAVERFAEERGRTPAKRVLPSLKDERFERVLYLHMAALASLEGLAFDENSLMDVILDHEEHFWEVRARQAEVTLALQKSLARQMVAVATLRGGVADSSTASIIASRLLGGRALSFDESALLQLLQRIYQRPGEDAGVFLPPLEPDLLGEGMVVRVASPQLQGDRLPADWIDRVFPPAEETHAMSTGLEVLGRASATVPEAIRPWLERLLAGPLRSRARIALDAAKAVGRRTAFSVLGDVLADRLEAEGDVRLAFELDSVRIPSPSVSLGRVAAWASRTVLQSLTQLESKRGHAIDRAGRVLILNNLATQLSALGRREEALEATREAVELSHGLVSSSAGDFRPHHARSLSTLGNRLSELGQREAALDATREAVELYRLLSQNDPEGFRSDLARSLNNLGVRLGELGRSEDALQATRESIELYRALTEHNPDEFRPDLARSLNNLGAMLGSLGQHEAALAAADESVDLCRALAQRNPDAFQPYLAMGLDTLGNRLFFLGRFEGAAFTYEAVELYRALAQRNPGAFLPEFAMSLNNLGAMLYGVNLNQEALEVVGEALDILWPFFERLPHAFAQAMARVLGLLKAVHERLQYPLPSLLRDRLTTFERLTCD